MDRILIILKKENGPRSSSAPALGLNTIIFKYVYWYMKQISGERLQDHWSSGFLFVPLLLPGPWADLHQTWWEGGGHHHRHTNRQNNFNRLSARMICFCLHNRF